jgi:hypothetical protein
VLTRRRKNKKEKRKRKRREKEREKGNGVLDSRIALDDSTAICGSVTSSN